MKHFTQDWKKKFDEWNDCGDQLDMTVDLLYERLGGIELMKLICQRLYSLAAEQGSEIRLDDVRKIQEMVSALHDEICELELEVIE